MRVVGMEHKPMKKVETPKEEIKEIKKVEEPKKLSKKEEE